MRKTISIFLCFIFFLSGCATPYQKKGLTGGFVDSSLGKDTFRVSYQGNGYTSRHTVSNYLLYRCAEITIENGYDYFQTLGESQWSKDSIVSTPGQFHYNSSGYVSGNYYYGKGRGYYVPGVNIPISKPAASAIIRLYKGQIPNGLYGAYDAKTLMESLEPEIVRSDDSNNSSSNNEEEFSNSGVDNY